MSNSPLQIVELRATNVKRLVAVTIRPDENGNLVVVSGRNGAGKSSVLDAIEMALGGRDHVPAEPIRRGADRAEVVLDLGEFLVRRTFTPGGGGSLVVSNKDGARFPSPQAMLDRLVGHLSFDPLAFARERGDRQAEILRQLLGLDFGDHDRRRTNLYAERAIVNREVASLKGQLDGLPQHADAPHELVSVADLAAQLQAAQAQNDAVARRRSDAAAAGKRAAELQGVVEATRAELARLQRTLAQQEAAAAEAATASAVLAAEVAALQDADVVPLMAQLKDAETVNAKLRGNQQREKVARQLGERQAASASLTQEIEAIDAAKASAIAASSMPVHGLGFSATGTVTLEGLPLEQASAAERLRVSVAIGLAMNPRLRVLLIRDASLLDNESLRLVAEMAATAKAQVWIERVAEVGEGIGIVIEDGVVRGAEESTAC